MTQQWFKTEHSKMVFDDRYALKDKDGNQIEKSPEEMWRRVANAIAEVEQEPVREYWANEFYEAMKDFKFVPGGRILSGAGSGADVTFYNCFVIPQPEDSYDGIFENIHLMGQIMRRGGGVGTDLSTLRPKGEYVAGTNGFSSGPVAFAELYSQTTNITSQGGSRRGALMLMLADNHPDIFEFVHVKEDLSKITGANLSVKVTDKFMDAVENDDDWTLEWGGKAYKTVKARELFDDICKAAHKSAEPGLWFSERSNKEANSWYFEELIATNPCGEQPLGAWNVCLLGALNLSKFVDDQGNVLWDDLGDIVDTVVRFLDNVIDATPYHFEENEKAQKDIRRIGLGSMGLADMLIKCGIRYGSPEAVSFTDRLYEFIANRAYKMSAMIAEEKGSFPKFDKEKYMQGKFIQKLSADTRKLIEECGIRNCYVLTQAPTGSTGSLAQVAGTGIEPVFEFEFRRSDRLGEHIVRLPIVNELVERGVIPKDRNEWPDYMVTARELTPYEHVDMQAVIQKWNDSAISKTVNAPKTYTPKDVGDLYKYAYKNGLKGITVYVDGSREGVLNYIDEDSEEVPEDAPKFTKRPQILSGKTIKTQTPFGKAYVTINENTSGNIEEVFVKLGKTGADISAIADGLAIALTGALSPRLSGLTSDEKARWIIKKFSGISGETSVGFGPNRVDSLPDAIAQALKMYVNEGPGTDDVEEYDTLPQTNADICPECGSASLVKEEGCSNCKICGFSKCS